MPILVGEINKRNRGIGFQFTNQTAWIEDRYKLTVYYQRDYGELFDLKEDPKEVNNLWYAKDATGLKSELINKLLFAEMGKESLPMPRVSGA